MPNSCPVSPIKTAATGRVVTERAIPVTRTAITKCLVLSHIGVVGVGVHDGVGTVRDLREQRAKAIKQGEGVL